MVEDERVGNFLYKIQHASRVYITSTLMIEIEVSETSDTNCTLKNVW
jgi:hypothetical protein